MSARAAPRLATWLLERLGTGSRLDPLIGDLLEQFEEGRSRLWYWRQAVDALVVDVAQGLRLHAPSFIAAVVVGCASIWLWEATYLNFAQPLHGNLSAVSRHPWTAQALLRAVGMELIGIVADAVIVVTVWAVLRIHRSHPRTVLAAFVAAVTAPYLPLIARFAIEAATDPRRISALWAVIAPFVWQALCIFAAGLWIARRARSSRRGRSHFAAIAAVSLCITCGLARCAGRVGEITFTVHESYISEALTLGIVAYLVLLLWPPNSTSCEPSPAKP